MNSKERVKCTLRFQEPDRIPVGEFAVDYEMVSRIVGRPSLYRGRFLEDQALAGGRWDELAEDYVTDYSEVIDAFGWDVIVVTLLPPKSGKYLPWLPTAEEGVYTRGDGLFYSRTPQNWMVKIRDERAVKGNPLPALDSIVYKEPELPDESCFASIDGIMARYSKTHYIVIRPPIGIDYPMFGADEEDCLQNLLLEEETIERYMQVESTRRLALLKKILDRYPDMDGVIMAVDYSCNGGPLVSPKLYRRWVLPGARALADEVHARGKTFFQHSCGNNWVLMDMFVEAGVDVYQSIQMSGGMDMEKLKRLYGDRMTLWGGAGMEALISGTPDDVRREIMHSLKVAAPGGGYIAGASHSIGVGVKYENYMAMLDVVRQYGKYPIQR